MGQREREREREIGEGGEEIVESKEFLICEIIV